MGSQCSTFVGDYESYAVFYQEIRVSRKEHKCVECGNTINKGEKYEVSHGLYDGRWDTHKTCVRCLDLHESLSIFSCYQDFRLFGTLLETAEEYIYECMMPNLRKSAMALPYLRKLATAKRGKALEKRV